MFSRQDAANAGENPCKVMEKTLHGPYAKPETGNTGLYPVQAFDESQLRWAFTRKIYSIFTVQLLFIMAAASLAVLIQPAAHFIHSTSARLALYILAIFIRLLYAESSSYKDLLALYEKSKIAFAMKYVLFGFATTNMFSQYAINQRLAHFVSALYGHPVVTVTLMPFAYILNSPLRCLGPRNFDRGIILVILLMMTIAVASKAAAVAANNTAVVTANDTVNGMPEATSSTGGVPVADKLPPNCHHVDNCGDCFPCENKVCCESL